MPLGAIQNISVVGKSVGQIFLFDKSKKFHKFDHNKVAVFLSFIKKICLLACCC
jgi:hypothetical protein